MKNNYFYVLVHTTNGDAYVTWIDPYDGAIWDANSAPKAFDKNCAEEVLKHIKAYGVDAEIVESEFEILYQPN